MNEEEIRSRKQHKQANTIEDNVDTSKIDGNPRINVYSNKIKNITKSDSMMYSLILTVSSESIKTKGLEVCGITFSSIYRLSF